MALLASYRNLMERLIEIVEWSALLIESIAITCIVAGSTLGTVVFLIRYSRSLPNAYHEHRGPDDF